MADVSNLTRFLGDVADSIRLKKGTTEPIQPKDFDTEISTIDTSGLNTYDATATANDIVADKTAYANGKKITGTVTDNRGTIDEPKTVTLGDKTVTYTNSDNGYGGYMRIEMTPDKASVIDATSKVTTDVLGKVIADNVGLTPDILANGVTLLGVEGVHAALPTEELSVTPTTEEQTYEGVFSKVIVAGDEDLKPENIKKGVQVFGVSGTHTGSEEIVYTELEYIESTGTQYIDTGIAVSPTIGYDTVFAFTATNHTTAETIIGGRVALQDSMIGLMWNSQGYLQFNYGNVYYNSDFTYGSDETHYVSDGKNLYVNDELLKTASDSEWGKLYDLYLFAQNTAGSASQYAVGKMKYMKIYSSDILVRDFIPVLDSDGVACLFDKVTSTFFYSKGDSDFVGGPAAETVPDYEQLINYTMLYDYGDECLSVGDSWAVSTDLNGTLTKNEDHMQLYLNNTNVYGRWVTANKDNISLESSDYVKYGIISHVVGGCYNLRVLLNSNAQFLIDLEDTDDPSDSGHVISNRNMSINRIFDYPLKESLTYAGVTYNCASAKNMTPLTMKVYALFLLKEDDWQTLASLAGLSVSTIDGMLLFSDVLLSNRKAVEFMIKQCTGSFMVSAVKSSVFLGELSISPYKTVILANEHWAKFLTMGL